MKKSLISIVFLAFISFSFYNCSDQINPAISDTEQKETLKKPKKPKPPKEEASILNLTFGETVLIENDNLPSTVQIYDHTTHPSFDLENLPLDISYEILSSIQIQNVKVELRYDANVNSSYRNTDEGDDLWLEKRAVVSNNWVFDISGNNYSHVLSWDGKVFDRELDFLSDKLATYDFTNPENTFGGADHYLVTITAFSDAPSVIISKTAYIWINNAFERSEELFVENIQITHNTNKNKTTPMATVTLGNQVNGAYIYGKWSGLANNSALYFGPSVDGVIIFEGDAFRKNESGDLTFKVTNIQHQDGIYNPWLNTLWIWPDRPLMSISYP